MSAVSLLPNEVLMQIFYHIPTSEITTNCRAVCKSWNNATEELSLWQKIAASNDIEIEPTAKKIETAVRGYLLGRHIVVSTNERLKEKFINYFKEIPEGETKALCYRSASNAEAFGFYIRTKNPDVSEKLLGAENMKALQELFPSLKGLTITGKGVADHVAKDTLSSIISGCKRMEMQNLKHKLELKYFSHKDVDRSF